MDATDGPVSVPFDDMYCCKGLGAGTGKLARFVDDDFLRKLAPSGSLQRDGVNYADARIIPRIQGMLSEVGASLGGFMTRAKELEAAAAGDASATPGAVLLAPTATESAVARRCREAAEYFMANPPLDLHQHAEDPFPHACHGAIRMCEEARRATTGLERLVMTQLMFVFTACARFHPCAPPPAPGPGGASPASGLALTPMGRETADARALALRTFLFGSRDAAEARPAKRPRHGPSRLGPVAPAPPPVVLVLCRLCAEATPLDGLLAHARTCAKRHADARHVATLAARGLKLLKPVSFGAFGKVFLARKLPDGPFVAVKAAPRAGRGGASAPCAVEQEAEGLRAAAAAGTGPGAAFVVAFADAFADEEDAYLAMEWCNGGDLYSLLQALGCLDEGPARLYAAEIVLALEHLHAVCGIVHRDLKPANVLVGDDGHLRLADFGLSYTGLTERVSYMLDDVPIGPPGYIPPGPDATAAAALAAAAALTAAAAKALPPLRAAPTDSGSASETPVGGLGSGAATPGTSSPSAGASPASRVPATGAINMSGGTPEYLAPEVLCGYPHGSAVDWWALGVMLYELLTGTTPFAGLRKDEVFANILGGALAWPVGEGAVSVEARSLIEGLLHPDPSLRLGSGSAAAVKAHPFFKGTDWDRVAAKADAPPFVPEAQSADTGYFAPPMAPASTKSTVSVLGWFRPKHGIKVKTPTLTSVASDLASGGDTPVAKRTSRGSD